MTAPTIKAGRDHYNDNRPIGAEEQVVYLENIHRDMLMPFAISDTTGRIVCSNKAFEKLIGYTGEELKAMTWQMLTPEYLKGQDELIAGQLSFNSIPSYEKEYLRKDGSRVPVEIFINHIKDRDGRVVFYYLIISDISARKKAEMQRRERATRTCGALSSNLTMVS